MTEYRHTRQREDAEKALTIAKARLIPVWVGLMRKKHNSPDYTFTPYKLKALID